MNLALGFDTETSGLPLFQEPSEDPRQPHIVQLAAILLDLDTGRHISALDVIVAPTDWEIPDEVAKIHGITTAYARQVGIPEAIAVRMFIELWRRAEFRIAHNEQFDARILRIALCRFAGICDPEVWKRGRAECTQAMSTPILKLPPTPKMLAAGFNKPKSANLREAYKYFVGTELVDAHSAMADALGCLAVYQAIRTPRAIPAAAAGVHA